jgi:hypothetical protein
MPRASSRSSSAAQPDAPARSALPLCPPIPLRRAAVPLVLVLIAIGLGRSVSAGSDPAADSLAAPDSAAVPDSLTLPDSSAVPDSAAATVRPPLWWRRDWLLAELGQAAGEPVVRRSELFRSSAGLFSEVLERHTSLGLHRAGSPIAWDLPYDLGPGVERLSLWLDGSTTMGPAVNEAQCQTLSPLLLSEVRYLAPDPFLDPLGAGGDGMVWTSSQEPAWDEVPSQVRFTEGVGRSGTEDVLYARQIGAWRTLASYAHASTEGRQYYPNGIQRYGNAGFQNLRFEIAPGFSTMAPHLTVSDRTGKYTLYGNRKLLWSSTELTTGVQLPWGTERTAQIGLAGRSERLQWWGPTDSGRREAWSVGASAHTALPVGPARLLFASAYERVRLRLSTYVAGDSTWDADGMGIALGWRWGMGAGPRGVTATVGWTDPWWTRGHGRARLVLVQRLAPTADLSVEAWTGRASVFIPRLEPDGDALLREGLHLLGEEPAPDGPVRRLYHVELGSCWRPGSGRLAAAVFARRIEDALGLDPDEAGNLLLDARTRESLMTSLGEATLMGARLQGRVPIAWGFRVEGAVTAVLDPPADRLPVLLSPYHGRAGVFLMRRVFKGDLELELGGSALGQGEWQTPQGAVPARVQFDAEIRALFLERALLFVQIQNLTDEFFESATYDGSWGSLPFRSSTIGFEWHFSD